MIDDRSRTTQQAIGEIPAQLVRAGNAILAKTRDWRLALELVEHALRLEPRCFDALYNKAIILLELGMPQDALKTINTARSVRRRDPGLYLLEARCLSYLDSTSVLSRLETAYDLAFVNSSLWLDQNPATLRVRSEILLDLESVCVAKGRHDLAVGLPPEAFQFLTFALNRWPELRQSAALNVLCGEVCLKTGRFEDALRFLKQAAEIRPKYTPGDLRLIAQVCELVGDTHIGTQLLECASRQEATYQPQVSTTSDAAHPYLEEGLTEELLGRLSRHRSATDLPSGVPLTGLDILSAALANEFENSIVPEGSPRFVGAIIAGPPGSGKTTLLYHIAKLLKLPQVFLPGDAISTRQELLEVIKKALEKFVSAESVLPTGQEGVGPTVLGPVSVVVDEISAMPATVLKTLSGLSSPESRPIEVSGKQVGFSRLIVIATTSRPETLPKDVVRRFGTRVDLRPYAPGEMRQMLLARLHGVPTNVVDSLVMASHGVPRRALRLATELRSSLTEPTILTENWDSVLERLAAVDKMDKLGVNESDRRVLKSVLALGEEHELSQLVGTLKAAEWERIREESIPVLEKVGFLKRGRNSLRVTHEGIDYLEQAASNA